jgi:hypothetical protein
LGGALRQQVPLLKAGVLYFLLAFGTGFGLIFNLGLAASPADQDFSRCAVCAICAGALRQSLTAKNIAARTCVPPR